MNWERAGAASGILVAILFAVSFVVFLGTDPTSAPKIPDLENAPSKAAAYIGDHKDAIKTQLLLNSIAMVLFLWFLGSLWSAFRSAEGGPARVSAIASAGAIVGTGAILAGFVFGTAAVQDPNTGNVGLLYSLDVLSIGLGGAAFTVFFLASAKVILKHGALPAALGLLALVAGVASAFGFVSIFAEEGIFNPATGAIGFWARFGTFVLFVLFASLALTAGAGRTTRRRRR